MPEPESEAFRGPPRISWHDRAAEKIKAHEKGLLVLGGVAQLLFLATMALPHVATTMTGETILLRVVPVDPRDLFRGDYVTLSYEISRVPDEGIDGVSTRRMHDPRGELTARPVYVALEPEADGKHYRGASVHFNPPASGKFIRGTLENSFRINFGLESYYVQEGRGKEYENAVRNHALSAAVALTPAGSATLQGLVIDAD